MNKPKHTTDGEPPTDDRWDASAPKPIDDSTGQHGSYWVLPESERAKGFVRPVRRAYKHVGAAREGKLRPLTSEEEVRFAGLDYVRFEAYPPEMSPKTGRFWTQAQLDSTGCGMTTTMSQALAETYARDPSYYGSTFCHHCRDHLPVGEFVWNGTDERVGT